MTCETRVIQSDAQILRVECIKLKTDSTIDSQSNPCKGKRAIHAHVHLLILNILLNTRHEKKKYIYMTRGMYVGLKKNDEVALLLCCFLPEVRRTASPPLRVSSRSATSHAFYSLFKNTFVL